MNLIMIHEAIKVLHTADISGKCSIILGIMFWNFKMFKHLEGSVRTFKKIYNQRAGWHEMRLITKDKRANKTESHECDFGWYLS